MFWVIYKFYICAFLYDSGLVYTVNKLLYHYEASDLLETLTGIK